MARAKLINTKIITKLEDAYKFYCTNWSDIYQHMSTLFSVGTECTHITEMGVRTGRSTIAWLYSHPQKLICYDLKIHKDLPIKFYKLWAKENNTEFIFIIGNTLKIEIEETDLLFIDTLHTYTQLQAELNLHSNKVKKYTIIHDTETFKKVGMDNKSPGMEQAITEFINNNQEWEIYKIYNNNNGLTILKRKNGKKE